MANGRTIKFRAWDKKSKIMYDSAYGDWIAFDGCTYTSASTSYDTPNIEIEKYDDYILMQYTGLQDKNGKDIYEGDIVQFVDGGRTKFEVKWETIDDPEVGYYAVGFSMSDGKNIEVIGNVHENPELLEE